jgi:hypothetical protein
MALVADGAAWVAAIASLITALVTGSALALAWWQGPKALRAYRAGIEAQRQRAAAEVEAREAVRDRRLQAILEQMRKP